MNAPEPIVAAPVRFSHLRAYGRSAAHGAHARSGLDDETTRDMERGTAVHAIVFGTRKVCGYPGKTRQGKDYDAFVKEHPDTEILTKAEYEKAYRMADAVLASKVARPMLQGVREETLLFRWNGLDCRVTPDVRGDEFNTELKTSASADPSFFPWHSRRMHYHVQMRFQQIGRLAKGLALALDSYVVAVESKAPFPVTVFRIEERALIEGEKLLMLWAERLKTSEESRRYPPYVECIVPLDIPDEDVKLEFGPEDEDADA